MRKGELEGRLDAEYYFPERVNFFRELLKCKNIVKLKRIIKSCCYGILPKGDSYHQDEPISLIRATEMKPDFQIDFKHALKVPKEYFESKRARLEKNDVLLAVKGATIASVKCVAFVDSEVKNTICNGSICKIQVNEQALPKYLAFVLDLHFCKMQMKYNLIANNAVDYLDKPLVNNLLIPLPDIFTQAQIVSRMDAGYADKKQKEAEAQRLLESIDGYLLGELGIELPEKEENTLRSRIFRKRFSEISGGRIDPIYYFAKLDHFNSGKYESVKLSSVVSAFVSGVGAGKQDQATEENGIIQIRPTNIDQNGNLKYDRNVYLPADFSGEKVGVDDVIFNNTNSQELVGKTSILKEDRVLFFSNHITRITVNKSKLSSDYLMFLLNSYQKNKVFYSICTNWNNQSGVGLELMKSLKIPLPPLSVQTEIACRIAEIRSRAKQLQQEAKDGLELAKRETETLILGHR